MYILPLCPIKKSFCIFFSVAKIEHTKGVRNDCFECEYKVPKVWAEKTTFAELSSIY